MVTNDVWESLDKKDLPEGAKVITSTWACKKKSNGTYHDKLNARRFEQIAGKYFDPTSTAAPVTNNTAIRIVLVLMLLANCMARGRENLRMMKKFSWRYRRVWNITIGVQQ